MNKYNRLSWFSIACMCTFMDDHLIFDNQLRGSTLGNTNFLSQQSKLVASCLRVGHCEVSSNHVGLSAVASVQDLC